MSEYIGKSDIPNSAYSQDMPEKECTWRQAYENEAEKFQKETLLTSQLYQRIAELEAELKTTCELQNAGISHDFFDAVCCERDTAEAKLAKATDALQFYAENLTHPLGDKARETLAEIEGRG